MLSARRCLALILPALLAASLLVAPAASAVNPPHGSIVSAAKSSPLGPGLRSAVRKLRDAGRHSE